MIYSTIGEVCESVDIQWMITSIPFPLFNSVFPARLAPNHINSAVQSIIMRARARDVPVLWWIGPQTQPADLGQYLEASGFTCVERAPGMAADLMALNEDWASVPGLDIRRVSDADTLREWCQVSVKGFEMPGFVTGAFFDFINCLGTGLCGPYLAYLDSRPVATSLSILAAGVAGIYNVTTIPEARRKGIGTLITLTGLRDARAMGYRVGILQASEMGVGIYRRLGFHEYCRVNQYM